MPFPISAGAPCTVASSGEWISRLPKEEASDKRNRFKSYQIGYVHIDSCELRHTDGKLVMFLAIDRISKFTYVEFHRQRRKEGGSSFSEKCRGRLPLQNPHRANR